MADGQEGGEGGGERTVPFERFARLNEDKKALAAELASLRGEVQSLTERAATADTLAQQIAELKEAHKSAAGGWAEERALLTSGITDPEDADLVRHYYGRQPAETRPKSIGEYVAALKADGASVPKGLSHLFAAAGAGAGAGGANGPPKPRAGGDGHGTGPGAGAGVTAAAIQAATAEFQRTGSDAAREALTKLLEAARAR